MQTQIPSIALIPHGSQRQGSERNSYFSHPIYGPLVVAYPTSRKQLDTARPSRPTYEFFMEPGRTQRHQGVGALVELALLLEDREKVGRRAIEEEEANEAGWLMDDIAHAARELQLEADRKKWSNLLGSAIDNAESRRKKGSSQPPAYRRPSDLVNSRAESAATQDVDGRSSREISLASKDEERKQPDAVNDASALSDHLSEMRAFQLPIVEREEESSRALIEAVEANRRRRYESNLTAAIANLQAEESKRAAEELESQEQVERLDIEETCEKVNVELEKWKEAIAEYLRQEQEDKEQERLREAADRAQELQQMMDEAMDDEEKDREAISGVPSSLSHYNDNHMLYPEEEQGDSTNRSHLSSSGARMKHIPSNRYTSYGDVSRSAQQESNNGDDQRSETQDTEDFSDVDADSVAIRSMHDGIIPSTTDPARKSSTRPDDGHLPRRMLRLSYAVAHDGQNTRPLEPDNASSARGSSARNHFTPHPQSEAVRWDSLMKQFDEELESILAHAAAKREREATKKKNDARHLAEWEDLERERRDSIRNQEQHERAMIHGDFKRGAAIIRAEEEEQERLRLEAEQEELLREEEANRQLEEEERRRQEEEQEAEEEELRRQEAAEEEERCRREAAEEEERRRQKEAEEEAERERLRQEAEEKARRRQKEAEEEAERERLRQEAEEEEEKKRLQEAEEEEERLRQKEAEEEEERERLREEAEEEERRRQEAEEEEERRRQEEEEQAATDALNRLRAQRINSITSGEAQVREAILRMEQTARERLFGDWYDAVEWLEREKRNREENDEKQRLLDNEDNEENGPEPSEENPESAAQLSLDAQKLEGSATYATLGRSEDSCFTNDGKMDELSASHVTDDLVSPVNSPHASLVYKWVVDDEEAARNRIQQDALTRLFWIGESGARELNRSAEREKLNHQRDIKRREQLRRRLTVDISQLENAEASQRNVVERTEQVRVYYVFEEARFALSVLERRQLQNEEAAAREAISGSSEANQSRRTSSSSGSGLRSARKESNIALLDAAVCHFVSAASADSNDGEMQQPNADTSRAGDSADNTSVCVDSVRNIEDRLGVPLLSEAVERDAILQAFRIVREQIEVKAREDEAAKRHAKAVQNLCNEEEGDRKAVERREADRREALEAAEADEYASVEDGQMEDARLALHEDEDVERRIMEQLQDKVRENIVEQKNAEGNQRRGRELQIKDLTGDEGKSRAYLTELCEYELANLTDLEHISRQTVESLP